MRAASDNFQSQIPLFAAVLATFRTFDDEPLVSGDGSTATTAVATFDRPLECSSDQVATDLFDPILGLIGCAHGWAIVQIYDFAGCGTPCTSPMTWGIVSPTADYLVFPFSYCRSQMQADGAPAWLLEAVGAPNCSGTQQAISYHDEPTTGELRLGDHGQRVKNLQDRLIEFEAGWISAADGYFGWDTERALRVYQASNNLPLDGVATAELGDPLFG